MNETSYFIGNLRVGRQNLKISKQTSTTASVFLKGKHYPQDTTAVFLPIEMEGDDILLEETVVRTGPKCNVKLVITTETTGYHAKRETSRQPSSSSLGATYRQY